MMWIFSLLVAGLCIAIAVFVLEMQKVWRLRRAVRAPLPRIETSVATLDAEPPPVSVPGRADRWCRDSWVDPPVDACKPRPQRDAPMLSEIIRKPPESFHPSAIHPASRPGELVAPEALDLAPPVPPRFEDVDEGEEITFQRAGSMFSVEIDLEDLLDTQPSVALTAEEAEEILGRPTDPLVKTG